MHGSNSRARRDDADTHQASRPRFDQCIRREIQGTVVALLGDLSLGLALVWIGVIHRFSLKGLLDIRAEGDSDGSQNAQHYVANTHDEGIRQKMGGSNMRLT